MGKKIVYLLLLAVLFFLSVMFRYETTRFLLIFFLILPVVLAAMLQFMAYGVRICLRLKKDQIQKGETWTAVASVDNPGRLSLSIVRLELEYEELQTGKKRIFLVRGKSKGKSVTDILCSMEEHFSGKIRISLKNAKIFDYMGLFSKKLPVEGQGEIMVFPPLNLTAVTQKPRSYYEAMDALEYDDFKPGSDVSEIFQIREYQKGDHLQRVHWKLSAREDNLLVKDYSYPLGYRAGVYLDFYMQKTDRSTRGQIDGMVELAMALSFSMAMAGCPHYLFWCNGEGVMRRLGVRQEEDLYEAMEAVLAIPVISESFDSKEVYRRQYGEEPPRVHIVVNGKLEVWKDGNLLECFRPDRLENQLETFSLII